MGGGGALAATPMGCPATFLTGPVTLVSLLPQVVKRTRVVIGAPFWVVVGIRHQHCRRGCRWRPHRAATQVPQASVFRVTRAALLQAGPG